MKPYQPLGGVLIAAIAAILATLFRVKTFAPWSQVSYLWDARVSPVGMIIHSGGLIGHPHTFRYLVSYPGLILESSLPGIGFSLYAGIFFVLNVLLLKLVAQLWAGRCPSPVIYLIFIGVQFLMNGRGIFAWSGWLLCVWICLRLFAGHVRFGSEIGWIALSCFLSTVSTGVFVIVATAFAMFVVISIKLPRRHNQLRQSLLFIAWVPLLYLLASYFSLAINKNLRFYGQGLASVKNMLGHGMGSALVAGGPMILMLIFSFTFTILVLLALNRSWFSSLNCLICLAFAGGLFGFTVLSLSIPLLLVRSLVRIPKTELQLQLARGYELK